MNTKCGAPIDPATVLSPEQRQPCEVWTRVMGYHRPVSSFNIGKKGEHQERRFFRENPSGVVEVAVCGKQAVAN